MKTLLNILKKILLGLGGLLLLSFLLLFLFFQVPAVQNYVADQALKIARNKLDTEIGLERVVIIPPNSVKLKEIYLGGSGGDTLFYSEAVSVNVGLFKLLKKEIELNRLKVSSTKANLIRSGPDSTFNFPNIKKSTEKKKTGTENSSSEWNFDIDRIILDKVDFEFLDENMNNSYNASVGNLRLKMRSFDPKIPTIGVQSIKLEDSNVELFIRSGKEKKEDKESRIPEITLNRDIEIEDVNFLMVNASAGQKLSVNNINLYIEPDELNLPDKEILIEEIDLEKTIISLVPTGNIASTDSPEKKNEEKSFDWSFEVKKLTLRDNDFEIRTEKNTMPSPGFNPQNINTRELSAVLSSVSFNSDSARLNIEDLQFIEGREFKLDKLSSNISVTPEKAIVEGLIFRTPHSRVKLKATASNYDPDNIKNSWRNAYVNFDLGESYVGINDIQYFNPEFSAGKYHRVADNLILTTKAHGKISDISLENFRAHLNDDVIVRIRGNIRGLPEIDNINGDIKVDSIYIAGNTSRYYFPDSMIPSEIFIPENFLLQAAAQGNKKLSKSTLKIKSGAGGLRANLQLSLNEKTEKEFFQADISSRELDLGKILQKPDTLGKVSLSAGLNGSTKKFKQLRADVRLDIDTFHLIRYPYSNFSLNGDLEQKKFQGTAGMDDENIRFSFNGMIDASDSIPDMDFNFNLIGANLMALNLAEEDIRVGAMVSSSVSGSKLDNLNGKIKLNDLIFVRDNEIHELDSMLIKAKNLENQTELTASSRILQASYKGTVKPSDISFKLWSHLNLFFSYKGSQAKNPVIPGKFNFEAHIDDHDLISGVFLPGLNSFQGIDIKVDYDEENNELNSESIISPINYKNIDIDSVYINANSKDSILLVKIDSKGFRQDLINIPGILAEARLGNDIAKLIFKVTDQQSKEKYLISGTLSNEADLITAHFDSSKLTLNYDSWELPSDHSIIISRDSIIFKNLIFNNESQIFSLNKKTSGPGIKGTKVEFSAFELETLTNLLTTENLVNAEINGKITFDTGNGTRFNSVLQITDLATYGEEIFNMVAIKAEQTGEDRITFRGQLEDQQERIRLKGFYSLKAQNPLELDVNVKDLDIQSFQPLFSDMFETLTGTFNGDLNLSGTTDQLALNGDIQFIDGKIAPRMLGTTFRSKNIQLNLENNNLLFTHFTIMDPDGNEASVDGSINEIFSKSPELNIDVNADNFTGIDAVEGTNELFYGKLSLDISASVSGELSEPDIDGTTTITNNTDFHFIVPSPEGASIEQEGLVVFIESEEDTTSILYSGLKQEEVTLNTENNIDVTATIEVQEEAVLEIVVDPASGENLSIMGAANLNFNMRPGGQISLTGQYIINDGTYNLTLYDIIRRQFKIQEGSSITWTGDPLEAKTDITAYYRVRTSPEGLIANELSRLSDDDRRNLSQSIPFLVYLNIKGELLSPSTLDFDIETPPGVAIAEVSSKLNQLNQNESEVNKQAVALLTFGNFIQTQMSTAHPVSYEINAAARTSISRILSTQLNKLAEQYVEGIEINVDVSSYADYTGQQTQATTNVALDVQKQFLNERLTVQVGGKVNIEGNERQANNMNRLAGDVRVLYDLTEDGKFKLKGFNTTEYENIFEGEITKTGVGIIYNRDIYSLSDLFKKGENENGNNE